MAAMTPPVPLVFKSDERIPVSAKLVVVALVLVKLVAKKVVEVPAVLLKFVVKRLVEVAFVVVPLITERLLIDDDALMLIPSVVVGVRAPETMLQSLNAVGV